MKRNNLHGRIGRRKWKDEVVKEKAGRTNKKKD